MVRGGLSGLGGPGGLGGLGALRGLGGLRGAPRALREDLWTGAARRPPPRTEGDGWTVWQPALVLFLLLCAVALTTFGVDQLAFGDGYYQLGTGTAVPLVGVQSAALVLAAFRPVAAWWATTCAMVLTAVLAGTPSPEGTAHALAPWTGAGLAAQTGVLLLLSLRLRPRAAAGALTLSALAGAVCAAVTPGVRNGDVAVALAVLAGAAVVGAALRGRQAARTELVAQEELTAEERARRTLLEERNRIARELHDVVAHHMSVISIQAQAAPHLTENPSQELRDNLAGIRENAVEALTELRHVLGVLRSEEPVPDSVRHAPQPTLDRLDELVENVRGAGLDVTTRITGEPAALPPGVALSAFRIVQEALSNAMRHAPGSDVLVEIAHLRPGVTVRVVNTAPAGPVVAAPRGGHGLLGMRERTVMLGGELATGRTPDGGYEVTAILPVPSPRPPDDPAEDAP